MGAGKAKTFKAVAKRTFSDPVDACRAKDLAEYTRAHALIYRDYLIARGLVGSSVSTVVSSVRAVFHFAISNYVLDHKYPFSGMYFDKLAGVSKGFPIPLEDIPKVQHLCKRIDDDPRCLVTLISDTGMHLAEGAGLLKNDIILNADTSHISFQLHSWRPIKTSGSEESYRLQGGVSMWAANRLSRAFSASPYAFPRYNK